MTPTNNVTDDATMALTATILGDLPVDLSTLHADSPTGATGGDECPGLAFYYGIQGKEQAEAWCLTHGQQARWLEPGTILASIASRRVCRETTLGVDDKGETTRASKYAYEGVPNMSGASSGEFVRMLPLVDDKGAVNQGVSFLTLVWLPTDPVNPAAVCSAEAFKTICKTVYSSFDRQLKNGQGVKFLSNNWRPALTQNKAKTGFYIDPKKARSFIQDTTLSPQQIAAARTFLEQEPVKAAINAWLRR